MLETGVQARILLTTAIQGNTANDLASRLGSWFSSNNVVIHDLQIFQKEETWFAIIVFRK